MAKADVAPYNHKSDDIFIACGIDKDVWEERITEAIEHVLRQLGSYHSVNIENVLNVLEDPEFSDRVKAFILGHLLTMDDGKKQLLVLAAEPEEFPLSIHGFMHIEGNLLDSLNIEEAVYNEAIKMANQFAEALDKATSKSQVVEVVEAFILWKTGTSLQKAICLTLLIEPETSEGKEVD